MTCVTDGEMEIVLTGGPSDLPPTARTLRVRPTENKVKIAHRGGYEHFERDPTPQPTCTAPIVYRWTARTRVAE